MMVYLAYYLKERRLKMIGRVIIAILAAAAMAFLGLCVGLLTGSGQAGIIFGIGAAIYGFAKAMVMDKKQ